MPYQQLERINDRSQERFFLFLTLEHLFAVLATAFPMYVMTTGITSLWLRTLLVGSAIALGYSLTIDMGGLPLYKRVLWDVRGLVRQRLRGRDLLPEQLTGRRVGRYGRAQRMDSAVREVAPAVVQAYGARTQTAATTRATRAVRNRDLAVAPPLRAEDLVAREEP